MRYFITVYGHHHKSADSAKNRSFTSFERPEIEAFQGPSMSRDTFGPFECPRCSYNGLRENRFGSLPPDEVQFLLSSEIANVSLTIPSSQLSAGGCFRREKNSSALQVEHVFSVVERPVCFVIIVDPSELQVRIEFSHIVQISVTMWS